MDDWNYEQDGLIIDYYNRAEEYETLEDVYKGTVTLILGEKRTTLKMDYDDAITLWGYIDWLQDEVYEYHKMLKERGNYE